MQARPGAKPAEETMYTVYFSGDEDGGPLKDFESFGDAVEWADSRKAGDLEAEDILRIEDEDGIELYRRWAIEPGVRGELTTAGERLVGK
jgi:hypothetical protein